LRLKRQKSAEGGTGSKPYFEQFSSIQYGQFEESCNLQGVAYLEHMQ
jgi:hypothetical protein